MPNSPVSTPAVANKKLYNGGSEWQNDSPSLGATPYNLPDYYETYNRNYDAAIGRFIGIDPMAESVESMTGYQYGGGNPIIANDPDGALADISKQARVPAITSRVGSEFDGVEAEELQTENDWFYFGGAGPDFPIFGMQDVTSEYVGAGTVIGYFYPGASGTGGYRVDRIGNVMGIGKYVSAGVQSDDGVLFATSTTGSYDANNFVIAPNGILQDLSKRPTEGNISSASFTGDDIGMSLFSFLAHAVRSLPRNAVRSF